MADFPIDIEPVFVDRPGDFDQVCATIRSAPLIALDTEFIRTNTFYPKPGLIQITGGEKIFLLDPLTVKSWEKFSGLLIAEETTTIMHSCSEDLSLLQHMMQSLPARLFDTQRAAAFLGLGYSISYQGLVKAELDLDIPKGETRSDWLQRPLNEDQLSYAAVDVAYLIQLHSLLKDKLKSLGRFDWFEQDCTDLLLQVKDETCEADWALAYQSISGAWKLDNDQLALLQKLCFWREAVARKRNRPRSWILKDNELLALANRVEQFRSTQTTDQSYRQWMIVDAQVLSTRFATREADEIVEFLNSEMEFAQLAQPDLMDVPLSAAQRKTLKMCQHLAQEKAQQLAIAPELLARKRQWLELLGRVKKGAENIWPPGMDTWRREILEADVLSILRGQGATA